jgi:hypothetical protein
MVQNSSMRLDHVSYVTTHEQIADTVQRLGSLIGSTFVDGGIHPRFGTRNFTCALKNEQYIEVVCPLDHPATEQTPWGKAVKKKANEGGGWFTWVFSTEDIAPIEAKFGRKSVEGHRTLPEGMDLRWKQIGVKEIQESPNLPFFIQWLTSDHPSGTGNPTAELIELTINDNSQLNQSWFKDEILSGLGKIQINWIDNESDDWESGLSEVILETKSGLVTLN